MDARLWLVCLLCTASATAPGVQVGLSQATVNSFKNDLLPQVLEKLSTVQLNDIHKVLGNGFLAVTVSVTKILCTNLSLDVDNTNLVFTAPDSMVLTATELTGTMSFTWAYESPLGGDSGEGTIDLLPSTISATFKVAANQGKPVVTVSQMNFQISDLNVSITNSPIAAVANWLFSVMKENILSGLKDILDQYSVKIMDSVLSDFLGKYQPQTQLTETIAIDYQLVSNPVITSTYAEVGVLGAFIDLTHPNQVMNVAPPIALPQFVAGGRDVQMYISEYTLNTGLYAGMTSGAFQGEINSETPVIGKVFNTGMLSVAFPGLADMYGDKPCVMDCGAGQPAPTFTATAGSGADPGTLTGEFTLTCSLEVGGSHALSVNVTGVFGTEVSLENWVLNLTMTHANITNVETYASTLTEPANDEQLTQLMGTIVGEVGPKQFNEVFGNGMPLPTLDDVDLSDSELVIENGYLAALVTPKYHFELTL